MNIRMNPYGFLVPLSYDLKTPTETSFARGRQKTISLKFST